MTDKKYLETVFKQFVESNYTERELRDLLDRFQHEGDKAYLMQLIEQELGKSFADLEYPEVNEVTARVFKKLEEYNQLEWDKTVPLMRPRRFKDLMKIAAAIAAVFVIAFMGVYFYQHFQRDLATRSMVTSADIEPGSNRAKLFLSDGRELSLDDAQVGLLAKESGISVQKTSDGQLIYTIEHVETAADLNATNTISTPNGGQYRVVLPDGTRVWLNAASSLTYPVRFAGTGRQVKIEGEAYFEVAKSVDKTGKRIPFLVDCPDQVIEVLGTHFNVNAYRDEPSIKTTLIEGSVRLSLKDNRHSVLLQPGEQGNAYHNRIMVSEVDVGTAIDWKNGDFVFADEDLKAIMRKISRWYNVDVRYEEEPRIEHFDGQVSREKKLSEVLKVLGISADVNLKLTGQTISVTNRK